MKSNLPRIAKKINENQIEADNPFRVDDMIRATIIVNSPNQIVDAYKMIAVNPYYNIIKIRNHLKLSN